MKKDTTECACQGKMTHPKTVHTVKDCLVTNEAIYQDALKEAYKAGREETIAKVLAVVPKHSILITSEYDEGFLECRQQLLTAISKLKEEK